MPAINEQKKLMIAIISCNLQDVETLLNEGTVPNFNSIRFALALGNAPDENSRNTGYSIFSRLIEKSTLDLVSLKSGLDSHLSRNRITISDSRYMGLLVSGDHDEPLERAVKNNNLEEVSKLFDKDEDEIEIVNKDHLLKLKALTQNKAILSLLDEQYEAQNAAHPKLWNKPAINEYREKIKRNILLEKVEEREAISPKKPLIPRVRFQVEQKIL